MGGPRKAKYFLELPRENKNQNHKKVEDPWVERLAKSASLDINYNVTVQYLETKTDIENIPKEKISHARIKHSRSR